MAPREVIDPAKLAELTEILDDYCTKAGLQNDREAREQLAFEIMNLFRMGIDDPEQINRSLAASLSMRSRDRVGR